MIVSTLHLDGQQYQLDPSVDVAALKQQVVAAAGAGAAFVDFSTLGHGLVSALVTDRTSVLVASMPTEPDDDDSRTRASDAAADAAQWSRLDSWIDFDEHAW